MKVPFLDIKRMHEPIRDELVEITRQVIDDGWFVGGGYVDQFEKNFASYLDLSQCVGCGNGTDALELILKALDIGAGDEVIVPSFTWVSDAEVVLSVGARPVYADITSADYNMCPEHVEKKITSKTKAIIAVHLFGVPCDMEPLLQLARQHNLKVIEDCAQAHGATYQGKKVGSWGDAAAFSFYPTKNLGALGDGGAVVTDNQDLASKVRLLANHGQPKRDEHVMVGRNSRLDAIQAAVLDMKLKYLDQWNKQREELAQKYLNGLRAYPITLPTDMMGRVYHLFVIQTPKRDALKEYLHERGIETAIHYPKPIHKIAAYQSADDLPNAELAARQVLSLPLYPGLGEEQVDYVIEVVKGFFKV